MSLNYTAHYMFERLNSETLPEGERYGQGVCPVTLERVPVTAEEFKEISATIGRAGGYAKCNVIRLLPDKENFHVVDDSDEVIEGTVLD